MEEVQIEGNIHPKQQGILPPHFGPYCPLQPPLNDRRSDFSKSVHSGTKSLSPYLLTRTVVFSFLLLRFLWVDERVCLDRTYFAETENLLLKSL